MPSVHFPPSHSLEHLWNKATNKDLPKRFAAFRRTAMGRRALGVTYGIEKTFRWVSDDAGC